MKFHTLILASVSTIALASVAFAQTATPAVNHPSAYTHDAPLDRKGFDEHRAEHEAFREKLEHATPEEREKLIAERKAEWQKRYDAATPEQKAKMDEHRKQFEARHEEHKAEREAFHEKLKSASPEERAKLIAERKAEMRPRFDNNINTEQRIQADGLGKKVKEGHVIEKKLPPEAPAAAK